MDSRRFAELSAQNFNRIPVYRDVFADLDTPVSAYLKLAHGRGFWRRARSLVSLFKLLSGRNRPMKEQTP